MNRNGQETSWTRREATRRKQYWKEAIVREKDEKPWFRLLCLLEASIFVGETKFDGGCFYKREE